MADRPLAGGLEVPPIPSSPGSSRGTRKASEMQERRVKVARMYKQGMNVYEVAAALNISESTVSTDLKAIRTQWAKMAFLDMGAYVREELAKIALREQEAWIAFEKSKQDEEETTASTTTGLADKDGNKLPDRQTASRKKRKREGDPRWLDVVQKCQADRNKLLGVLVTKVEVTDNRNKVSITGIDDEELQRLTDEQLEMIAGPQDGQTVVVSPEGTDGHSA